MGVGKAGEAVPRQSPEGPDPESSGVAAQKSVVARGAGAVGVAENTAACSTPCCCFSNLGSQG